MSDPRLNSVHLPSPRREQFRAARHQLLNACGMQTLVGDRGSAPLSGGHTAILSQDERFPPGVDFILIDSDCVYPLKTGINTVGRMPDNDVVVADPYVSRRHVAIVIHLPGRCELHDVASKNGTLINDKPINGRAQLSCGDKIQLSDHVLLFLSKSGRSPERGVDQTLCE